LRDRRVGADAQGVDRGVHHAHIGRRSTIFDRSALMENVLADLAIESEAATLLMMRIARAFDNVMKRIACLRGSRFAAGKYWVSREPRRMWRRALECWVATDLWKNRDAELVSRGSVEFYLGRLGERGSRSTCCARLRKSGGAGAVLAENSAWRRMPAVEAKFAGLHTGLKNARLVDLRVGWDRTTGVATRSLQPGGDLGRFCASRLGGESGVRSAHYPRGDSKLYSFSKK